MDPDNIIMTLDENADVEIEANVETGKGYVSAIINESDEKIIGGECSTPGIISVIASCENLKTKKNLELNENSNVLLIGCEGDADEKLYEELLLKGVAELQNEKGY